MKTCLVLLTKTYPFDKGEEFIEDEVPLLAKAFDRLVIAATSTSDAPEQTRSVPANATILHIPASRIKRALPGAALSYLPFTNCRGYAGPEERAAVKGSLKRRGFLTYFLAKSEAVYRAVAEKLADCNLEQYDGVTFYSYWFYDIALAAVRLRDHCGAKAKRAVSRAHRYDLYADRNATGYLPLRPYLLEHLDAFLREPEFSSLLHGDLWSGNVLRGPDGLAWLIDPAACVGDFEADLAMTRLFGGFPESFYAAYREINPPDPCGLDQRRDLYQLYHLLNHLNLFGAAYLGSVLDILRRYGR